jgi:DNA-binding transcriptional LysR family regulator
MISDFRLKVFQTVADKLSFTKAAHELFITQPAITKHINELEKQIRHPLFIRHGNSISLTSEGELLLRYSRKIMSLYYEFDDELNSLQKHQSGHLRIGASTTIAQYILPRILAELKKSYPDVEYTLINDNSERIEQLLTGSKIDIGMIEGNTTLPQLHYEPFVNDEIVLVTGVNNKKLKQPEISTEVVKTLPLVIREAGSGTLKIVEQALEKHQIKRKDLKVEMQLGSTESIKQYLIHSQASAFLSIHSVVEELTSHKLKVIEIKGCTINRTFKFVSQHGQHARLMNLFKQYCTKWYNQK